MVYKGDKYLRKYLRENFSYARVNNLEIKYSEEDLQAAKDSFTENDIARFPDSDMVLKAIACLFFASGVTKKLISDRIQSGEPEKWEDYYEAIKNIDLLVNKFTKNDIITATFNGSTTEEKIKLQGHAIEIIKTAILDYWFSEESEIYRYDNEVKQTGTTPLAKQMIRQQTTENGDKQYTDLKYHIAYHTFSFLERISPGNNTRIVGMVLSHIGLMKEYIDWNQDAEVKSYIKRGKGLYE